MQKWLKLYATYTFSPHPNHVIALPC